MIFVFVFGHFWETEWYSYLFSVIFGKPNNICICIRSFLGNRIIFVFIFGHFWFWENEWYSYSYSVIFGKPNNIRTRIRSSKHYSLTSVPFWNFDFHLMQNWPENLSWYFLLWAFQPSFLSNNANLDCDQWLLHPFLNKNLFPVTSGGYFLGWHIYFCLTTVEYKFCCWTTLHVKN